MTKIPPDDILEGLYKLSIRESEKLKTVLELYQTKMGPDYHILKTMVKRCIEQDIRNKNCGARNGPSLMASMYALIPDLGYRPKILHELVLCCTNAKILDRDGRGIVGDDLDEQIWVSLDLLLLGDTLVTDLVEGVEESTISTRRKMH